MLTSSATTDLAGTYTITITAPGSGCSATDVTTVVINTLGITAANDGPACVGATVNLTSTPSGTAIPVYSWSGPAGVSSTLQNVSLSPAAVAESGTYTITVNSGGSGCNATATTSVTISSLGVTASNDGPTCVGLMVNLFSNHSGTAVPSGYTWSGPLSFAASTQNTLLTSSATTAMSGLYTVTVTAPGTGCTASATTNVTIIPLPAPITGANTVCVGLTSTLSDTTPFGTWSSTNTGVATIGSSGVIHTLTGLYAGTATISFTVGTGCASTLDVTVNPNPVIIGMAPVCVGSTLALSDDISGGAWTAANTHASVGSASGIITGLTLGTDAITYTLPTTCIATAVTTVK